jgi:hypothetical protein
MPLNKITNMFNKINVLMIAAIWTICQYRAKSYKISSVFAGANHHDDEKAG